MQLIFDEFNKMIETLYPSEQYTYTLDGYKRLTYIENGDNIDILTTQDVMKILIFLLYNDINSVRYGHCICNDLLLEYLHIDKYLNENPERREIFKKHLTLPQLPHHPALLKLPDT